MIRAAMLALFVLSGCADAGDAGDPERGRELFQSLSFGASGEYACSTCHRSDLQAGRRILPGASVAGVTRRPSFWGGQESDLLLAVNACRRLFMASDEGLVRSEPDAAALYAYLTTLEPGNAAPQSFTVVRDVLPLPRGDAAAGADVFTHACEWCHGRMGSGSGSLGSHVPILPDTVLFQHRELTPNAQRLAIIEKVRHGVFFDYGGTMPPFSLETLSDVALSDLLEALGVLGG